MSNEFQVLVLGAESTGKTLFLKRLQSAVQDGVDEKNFESVPSLVPTIGTNLASVVLNRKRISLRELGGAMAPVWKKYFEDAGAVVFMVDASNRFQISASVVLLYDVLKAEPLAQLPVLLLFNKTDLFSSLSIQEIKFIFRINDLKRTLPQKLELIECSTKTGDGMEKIIDWLKTI